MPVLKNKNHEKFAQLLAAGVSQAKSYSKVFPKASKGTIRANATRLVHTGTIVDRVREIQEEGAREAGLKAVDVMMELKNLAFSNVQDLYDDEGHLKPIDDLPPHVAAAISSMEVTEVTPRNRSESAQVRTFVTKVRMADKRAALDMAMKHLGLYEKDKPDATLPGAVVITGDMDAREAAKIYREFLSAAKKERKGD